MTHTDLNTNIHGCALPKGSDKGDISWIVGVFCTYVFVYNFNRTLSAQLRIYYEQLSM